MAGGDKAPQGRTLKPPFTSEQRAAGRSAASVGFTTLTARSESVKCLITTSIVQCSAGLAAASKLTPGTTNQRHAMQWVMAGKL